MSPLTSATGLMYEALMRLRYSVGGHLNSFAHLIFKSINLAQSEMLPKLLARNWIHIHLIPIPSIKGGGFKCLKWGERRLIFQKALSFSRE